MFEASCDGTLRTKSRRRRRPTERETERQRGREGEGRAAEGEAEAGDCEDWRQGAGPGRRRRWVEGTVNCTGLLVTGGVERERLKGKGEMPFNSS